MESPWVTHGVPIGGSVGCLWDAHWWVDGRPMRGTWVGDDSPRVAHGLIIRCPWDARGLTECPWDAHASLWVAHEMPMGGPKDGHGTPTGW